MSEIKWYETKMTSNTAPAPFVASASSSFNGDTILYGAYKAFDGKNNDSISSSTDYQAWASITSLNSWIKIDLGEPKEVDSVRLCARGSAGVTQTPTTFKIEGSIDDSNWVILGTFSKTWTVNEEAIFQLTKGQYRYLKITDMEASSKITGWSEITYGRSLKQRLVLKNPQTNQHYSLDNKTLIPLPDSSSKNMILHGIKTGTEIQLDEAFDKINYPVEGTVVKTMVKPLSIKFE